MKEKLKILIANDDGIRSEGIAKLARAAASFGTVWVAAPEHQCSGMSVRLTISEKSQMAVYRYDFPVPVEAAWSVDGTPADCVKVALNALLPFRPDIVLSGINDGLNAGLDVAYSGTIGAATEAAMHGVPAIATTIPSPSPRRASTTPPKSSLPFRSASSTSSAPMKARPSSTSTATPATPRRPTLTTTAHALLCRLLPSNPSSTK